MHIASPQQNNSRIAPLAVLPVFFDLADKTVAVIGGSEAAAWKTELLAAAGAQVVVLAKVTDCCAELMTLARSTLVAGSIRLADRDWSKTDLAGAALAVADIADDAEARLFVETAQRAGVPYNVIDRPQYCQFQFGGIVNRSPVVVGISTSGAAPILGQAIRRRIETLLPQILSAWAGLAHTMRDRVMAQLPSARQRRAYWERLSDRAFGDVAPQAADYDSVDPVTQPATGRVTLVGAGPGSADLLTVKAIRAMQSADVILFDDLVSAEVLELARREAKRMLVGKRAARESCRQEDINEMMLTLARQGKNVVRLKSGDPMIFGRAGEEIEMLERHGISVSVVPGITTALALASRLGISLTHRDYAQSVRFITGHSRKGSLPDGLNWPDLADPATTSIYYMSRRTLTEIVARLRQNGMDETTPVIVAANVGRPSEQIWYGTLGTVPAMQDAFPLDQPTIVAIGAALRRRETCSDFSWEEVSRNPERRARVYAIPGTP